MNITTTTDGTTAEITPNEDIDYTKLSEIRAVVATLPSTVTDVTWRMENARFMDIAGLHLLNDQRRAARRRCGRLTVTGLQPQPRRLLEVASEVFPAMDWASFLPSAPSPARV
ncbi:hypothetical protein NX801_28240 [Streptomyces sp. LP05-1]|uniref:STAS domain-containing protein n=1 Tax=Streptomyces pyxinae TaxID=2970734 RepID=A0ABT2CS99_9ACTN|nr:STAS domain-containing protein [Streptomyces sp. LP05-1]MCS0639454.1 hypothetical protein [Streptomyces sp. LP05-1]